VVDISVQALQSIVPFNFLDEDLIQSLIPSLTEVKYDQDTILFAQGQSRVNHLYIVRKGALEVYFENESSKTLQGFLTEDDIYGGISMLLNDGRSIRTVRVHENSVFYLLPKKEFLEICKGNESFSDFFTDTFGRRMLNRSYATILAHSTREDEDETMRLFDQLVAEVAKTDFISCPGEIEVREAAQKMTETNRNSMLIQKKDAYIGIITDKDLRSKVIAPGLPYSTRVNEIMSSPLITIPAEAPVSEAVLLMVERNIKHLAVTDAMGTVKAVLSNEDLLSAQGYSPVDLINEINDCDDSESIIPLQKKLPGLVKGFIANGARAENIMSLVTHISDTILKKLVTFALQQLGPAPAPFVFLVLGSEGRREQTLKTDQDNAILYADVPEEQAESTHAWFLKLGEVVCTALDATGYAFCKGDVMAKNPKWCQPLSGWKKHFTAWLHQPEPLAVMHSSIFYDFRAGYGDEKLCLELRQFLFSMLDKRADVFFFHMAKNALMMKPPLGFFRNFVVESRGEHRNTFDIKKAMTPIVDFARIHSLQQHVAATNTLDRLRQLTGKSVINEVELQELLQAYSFLMQVRLVRQVRSLESPGGTPDNYINPKKLTQIEQKMLKEIFLLVEKYQQKMSLHFTATA
jgi:CBS domain-containing protein